MTNRVFNDAPMIAEMAIRDQYEKARGELQLYMAVCAALVNKLGGEVELHQRELLLDTTIHVSMSDFENTFKVWVDGNRMIEDINNQPELPLFEEE